MTQTRLDNLTLLSIEHSVLRDIDLPTLIDNFALVKSCKQEKAYSEIYYFFHNQADFT